jgi:hypothetical protein
MRLLEVNEKPRNDDEKFRVAQKGRFHIHAQINSILNGYIKKKQDLVDDANGLDLDLLEKQTYLYGTTDGQIGIIQTIPSKIFYFLNMLEWMMNQELRSAGDFDQMAYRMNDPRDDPYEKLEILKTHQMTKRFIDGDFIETFSDLNASSQQDILDKTNVYFIPGDQKHLNMSIKWVESVIKTLKNN